MKELAAKRFQVWGRTYEFKSGPLPEQVIHGQDRLLAEPPTAISGPKQCALVWETGNHFTDNDGRLARAFGWCMEVCLTEPR